MNKLDQLDDLKRVIPSHTWRGFCMGFRKDGTPKGSNTTWAEWRHLIGLVTVSGRPTEKRVLTHREAFLLLIRSKLPDVCQELNLVIPSGSNLNIFVLEKIANRWLEQVGGQTWEMALNKLGHSDRVPGSKLETIINHWVGKPLSLRTIRRKCQKARIRFSKKLTYSPSQLNRIFRVL